MKTQITLVGLLVAAALVLGCAKREPRPGDVLAGNTNDVVMPSSHFIVSPAPVTTVNTQFKFVVLDFSSRLMPPVGTELSVYRGSKRVGNVRVTDPVRARFATADILDGEVRVGDEAR